MQTHGSLVGWAMPLWLRLTVYFGAGLVFLVGSIAAGLAGFSALTALVGGYLALWVANRLWLRRYSPPESRPDQGSE